MKHFVVFAMAAGLVVSSCSKKTVPATSKPGKQPAPVSKTTPTPKEPERMVVIDTPATANKVEEAAPVFNSPLIVIDESGKIVTPGDKLPEAIAAKVDYQKIAKGFSREQRKNLIYRFKMVPPRVLFVPADLASKSARGTYVIYKKKFYYWKKDDGLFHLDETYFQ